MGWRIGEISEWKMRRWDMWSISCKYGFDEMERGIFKVKEWRYQDDYSNKYAWSRDRLWGCKIDDSLWICAKYDQSLSREWKGRERWKDCRYNDDVLREYHEEDKLNNEQRKRWYIEMNWEWWM